MKLKYFILIFLTLLFSCKSINSNITEMDFPISTVYFSFDDGPNIHGETTERLLDVLKKHKIKAVFFLLGENAQQYPQLVKRIYEEGHIIANHGYSGKRHSFGMNDEEFRNNLLTAQDAISKTVDIERMPKWYRPHGGFYSSRQEEICKEEGFIIVPVTVRVYDAVKSAKQKKEIVNKTVNKIIKNKGGLILLHDGRDSFSEIETENKKNPDGAFNRAWIPDAVDEIIIALLEKGFILSELDIINAISTASKE